jgi:hypothetical protein
LAAFEWATLLKLRISLRNGSVFLGHSFKYRGYAALLIPKDQWTAQRNHHYGHLKANQDAQAQLGQYKELLRYRLDEFAKAVQDGRARVDDEGIHLHHQVASDEDQRVLDLRRALYAQHAEGQIAEMMLRIDSKVRFSWQLLGREPNSRDELLLAYASAMNLSTAMTSAEVARMIPGVSAQAVRSMTKRLCSEHQLRAAADAAFQYIQQFEIAGHWGRADLASSDMMSLDIPRNIWQARATHAQRVVAKELPARPAPQLVVQQLEPFAGAARARKRQAVLKRRGGLAVHADECKDRSAHGPPNSEGAGLSRPVRFLARAVLLSPRPR